jgi:DNA (cytosine-5)-methyltransferase 1
VPRLLDLYCCAGGASTGYSRAGFDITGVDIHPQPRYPYTFVRADALAVLTDRAFLAGFDVIVASPPCQAYSPLNALPSTKAGHEHPDLIGPTRAALTAWGGPFVIENVKAAPLDKATSIVLCGCMFGLRTYRERRFEPGGGPTLSAPVHIRRETHTQRTATSRRRERWAAGWHVSITGDVGTYLGPAAMGIDWMSGNELSEAIPPAYAEHVGRQLLAYLGGSQRPSLPDVPAIEHVEL